MIETLLRMERQLEPMRDAILKNPSLRPAAKKTVLWHLGLVGADVAGTRWHLIHVENLDDIFSATEKKGCKSRSSNGCVMSAEG